MRDAYYVLRLGSVFRIIYMDKESVRAWEHGGWEARPYETNSEAQAAMETWKTALSQKPPIPIP
jgi:hypothetical protein